MINMAKSFGVNISSSASGLYTQRDEVGTALGQASLTVEEQASTFATLANNGQYEAPHVIREIQQQLPGQALQTIQAKVATHQVLTPDENSDVDYALSFDDKPGGTAPNVGLADGREIIAKTGTTNLSQSAFFIGAIPQFSLAIGMFTNEQGCPASIAGCAAAANSEGAPPAGTADPLGRRQPAGLRRRVAGHHLARLRPEDVRHHADPEFPHAGLRWYPVEHARPVHPEAQGADDPDPGAEQHLPGHLLRRALFPRSGSSPDPDPGAEQPDPDGQLPEPHAHAREEPVSCRVAGARTRAQSPEPGSR